jgi:hypothetical protein
MTAIATAISAQAEAAHQAPDQGKHQKWPSASAVSESKQCERGKRGRIGRQSKYLRREWMSARQRGYKRVPAKAGTNGMSAKGNSIGCDFFV